MQLAVNRLLGLRSAKTFGLRAYPLLATGLNQHSGGTHCGIPSGSTIRASMAEQRRTMKIYTKTGDAGTSGLFNGERRPKDDDVFEALGVCDELNSSVGIALEYCELAGQPDVCAMLEEISSRLFDVGSAVATPINTTESQSKLAHTSFDEKNVEWLEKNIDQMDLELPVLKNFILPSGGLAASQLHMARTLARRAERRVWPLIRTRQVDPVVGRYLNRLSDFLFTAARLMSKRTGGVEKIYKKARVTKTSAEASEPAPAPAT